MKMMGLDGFGIIVVDKFINHKWRFRWKSLASLWSALRTS
jgi:hypothetical protein